jgi:hypothetical protein
MTGRQDQSFCNSNRVYFTCIRLVVILFEMIASGSAHKGQHNASSIRQGIGSLRISTATTATKQPRKQMMFAVGASCHSPSCYVNCSRRVCRGSSSSLVGGCHRRMIDFRNGYQKSSSRYRRWLGFRMAFPASNSIHRPSYGSCKTNPMCNSTFLHSRYCCSEYHCRTSNPYGLRYHSCPLSGSYKAIPPCNSNFRHPRYCCSAYRCRNSNPCDLRRRSCRLQCSYPTFHCQGLHTAK